MANILIIDDTPEDLLLLRRVLGTQHHIRAVNSGQRALDVASRPPQPDLILLDVIIPGMDGYAVLAALRENPATTAIPVLIVSSVDSDDDEERGLALGAADYISKPLRAAVVVARVRAHLELQAARELLQDHSLETARELLQDRNRGLEADRELLQDRNHDLELQVARRLADNMKIQDVSIRALARLAEIRDPETGNHLRRTQGYVRTLAEELSSHPSFAAFLTPHNIDILVKSAPLHDLGKVGIPDHILRKPGKLTADEWLIMKTHSYLGYRAIEQAEHDAEQPIEFLSMAKEVAHYHHEKWDGSGYPEGLAGEAIPISARLMALADVFDALLAQRVYKGALPLEQALQIITDGRGSHFDARVVDAFFACQGEFLAIAARHAESEA
ncbi:HD domain-containing phosphohydrolase [Candidatus Accumulibacter sp. ACC003]|uniref:HD domain-containing phosphohydrolase n=1 Tax=Candidatus Accumulibacter sp. ACC003 TaxID=2823334 RepID=UPI0025BF4C22|nr:HD domain-containing phosphohydrolase [Candidatus Accumulibacter sp. ACC003]